MKCPKCSKLLDPWSWHDGGYRGVQCTYCDEQWWSDTFGLAAYEVQVEAVRAFINSQSFPKDAETHAAWQARVQGDSS